MVALVGFGLMCLMVLVVVSTGFSQYNTWVVAENGLQARYEDNQNTYDAFVKTVMETAQVPTQYTQQMKAAYVETMQARMGEKGSQAMFQMIKEQNPNLDPAMYQKVQTIIESGRKDFKVAQTSLLDQRNTYKNSVETMPGVVYAKILGFPRVDLKKYDIVSSNETQEAFATKKDKAINVFQVNKE